MPAPKGKPANLPLSVLVLDPRLQPREPDDLPDDRVRVVNGLRFEKDHLDGLAEAVRAKRPVPRPKVMTVVPEGRDENNRPHEPVHYVVDGFYRTTAYGQAGRVQVPCEVFKGTWLDAQLMASAANQEHLAKRRTNADKRRAVNLLLDAFAGAGQKPWGDKAISEHLGVSDEFVRRMKLERATPEEEREAAAEKKKERKARPTVGTWRDARLEQFLKAEDYIWEAFEDHDDEIETAGQLWDALAAGADFGLKDSDLQAVAGEVRGLKEAAEAGARERADAAQAEDDAAAGREPEPEKPEVPAWVQVEDAYGRLVRLVNKAARGIDGAWEGRTHTRVIDALKVVFDGVSLWKEKLTPAEE